MAKIYVPVKDVLGHPGVTSGIIRALSLATASESGRIWPLFHIVAAILDARPQYIRDIVGSDFLKIVATYSKQPSPEYDLDCVILTVRRFYGHAADAALITPDLEVDFANAAVGLTKRPNAKPMPIALMIGHLTTDPNSVLTTMLFERLEDIPALYARAIAFPGSQETNIPAAFTNLLHLTALSKEGAFPNAIGDLDMQCTNAIATLDGWGQIRDILATADEERLPVLFCAIVRVCLATSIFS
ncbi:hypothetical protein BC828DRAFT_394146 [Blastocladiella britannica]|nr:hypothetical protein BC828DRAFT_394146 [Blastocladiella britannica]